ncbi:hypothetical protein IV203_037579 [Nitzschia inconspicua]|uniref:Uncharacterized protein n=2 Tax=Nitzschia inconspicua TaxID=303405 RepID=A0A9K3PYA0_9STRA|nr:hypothetical protein IV203_037579 [Nitzschia inconspicua]
MSLIQKYGEKYGQPNCGSIEDDPLIGINVLIPRNSWNRWHFSSIHDEDEGSCSSGRCCYTAVMPPLAERLNVRHQQVERNRQAIDAVLQGFEVVASETRTLALPMNHMVQSQLYYQGNVDTSASVIAACNANANDYSKRMEHRRQALPQHQALLFPMGIPQP